MSGTTTFVWRNGHRAHRLGLFPLWPQWVRVWEQLLHSTGTCVTTMGHIIVLNSQRVQQSQRLVSFIWLSTRSRYFWLSEMTRFTSFVPSTTHFIWLSSFIFKICASSNTIEYAVWTSGVAKNPGAVNILPWSVFDVHVRKIQKIKV